MFLPNGESHAACREGVETMIPNILDEIRGRKKEIKLSLKPFEGSTRISWDAERRILVSKYGFWYEAYDVIMVYSLFGKGNRNDSTPKENKAFYIAAV